MVFEKAKPFENELERVSEYRTVFGSPVGQKVLWDLIRASKLHEPIYNADPSVLACQQGERNLILRIISILERDPAQVKERMKEVENE